MLDAIIPYPNQVIERSCLSMVPIIPVGHEKLLQPIPQEMFFMSPCFQFVELGQKFVHLKIQLLELILVHLKSVF